MVCYSNTYLTTVLELPNLKKYTIQEFRTIFLTLYRICDKFVWHQAVVHTMACLMIAGQNYHTSLSANKGLKLCSPHSQSCQQLNFKQTCVIYFIILSSGMGVWRKNFRFGKTFPFIVKTLIVPLSFFLFWHFAEGKWKRLDTYLNFSFRLAPL